MCPVPNYNSESFRGNAVSSDRGAHIERAKLPDMRRSGVFSPGAVLKCLWSICRLVLRRYWSQDIFYVLTWSATLGALAYDVGMYHDCGRGREEHCNSNEDTRDEVRLLQS